MMIYPRLRIEVSYSSTLLAIWIVILAVLSWQAKQTTQGLTILLLSCIALTSTHGESRLLLPLLFLSERLLDDVMSLGNHPIEFYASTLLSYLTLLMCRRERRGQQRQVIFFKVLLDAVVGLVVFYFICKDSVISVGVGVFVFWGFLFFISLRPVLGENEAVLVSSLVGFYICDAVINSTTSAGGTILFAREYLTTKMHIASRGSVLAAIYQAIALKAGVRWCVVPRVNNSKSSERVISVRRVTFLFWSSLVGINAALHTAVSLQFKEDALLWLWKYITSSTYRTSVLLAWTVFIPLSVTYVNMCTQGLRKTARRKLFHLIAVIAFTPVAVSDPHFLSFALATASSIAVIVELARFYRVYGSNYLDRYMVEHIDNRDSIDGAVRTHIYLMYGLGLPMMLRYRHDNSMAVKSPRVLELSISVIPGLAALGIVDACAGIVGSTYLLSYRRALGRYLSNSVFTERANTSITHKTTTGTPAGLFCGFLFWLIVLIATNATGYAATWYTFVLVFISSLTECFTDGIDNLQLPLAVHGAVLSLFALLLRDPKMWN